MRFMGYLIKTLKENLRDWKILMFALAFAPCFIFILYAAYGQGNHSYNIEVINQDVSRNESHSSIIIKLLEEARHPDGVVKYRLHFSENREESVRKLKNKSADVLVIIPEDFSSTLDLASTSPDYKPSRLKLFGDPRNSRYAVASILLLTDIDLYVREATGVKTPLDLDETLIGEGKALTDFDLYVPGIVILALLNVMFTAGASFIKEIEKGTLQRLMMSRLTTAELIGSIGIVQIALCVISMVLTLASASLCGFEFHGSFAALLLVGLISSIGVIGLALISIGFLKSVYDLMTVGVIPYFVIMFFAGVFFPLPPVQIATLGEYAVRLNDFLPLSLSGVAMNKILNFGAGIRDIGFELWGTLAVSLAYYGIGLLIFRRRHMRIKT